MKKIENYIAGVSLLEFLFTAFLCAIALTLLTLFAAYSNGQYIAKF